jgi:ParB-like chromosome segregation protein Spo0J
MQTTADVYKVTVLGVDRKPCNDLEVARYDLSRHGEFGANPGDEELVRLVFAEGVKQPVCVRKLPDGYEVLDGARRTLALREANDLKRKFDEPEHELPIFVVETCNDLEAAITQVELNLNREDDDPISLGIKFRAILDGLCFNPDESKRISYPDAVKRLSIRAKRSESGVRQYAQLPTLAPDVQDQVRKGTLGIAAAISLIKLAPDAQSKAAAKLIESGNGKNAQAARQIRNSSVTVTNKPPKVSAEVWRQAFTLYYLQPDKDLEPKIDAIRIALGDLPIGHDPKLLALVQKVTDVPTKEKLDE